MSDQTPSTPEFEPPVEQPPVEGIPSGQAPAAWPTEGYAPPPAYPAAAEAPATWPAAYPPAYPPPAYPAAAAPVAPAGGQTSSNAIVALILAVVSWAICPIIPAIVALVFAANATKEIAASGGRIQGQGLVTASRIVSWINIGLWSAVIVIGGFFLVLAVVAGGLSNGNAG